MGRRKSVMAFVEALRERGIDAPESHGRDDAGRRGPPGGPGVVRGGEGA